MNLFKNSLVVVLAFAWTAILFPLTVLVTILTFNRSLAMDFPRRFWAPVILRLVGVKLRVDGLEKVDFSKPHVFVMNHQSTLDILVAFCVLPVPIRFVLKKELIYAPAIGAYCWMMGMIFVDRGNRAAAIANLKKGAKKIREGANIIAFPEGTRSPDGHLLPFKKGVFILAIESQVPVVPMAIAGSRLVVPLRSFRLTPGDVVVSIGDPVSTQKMTIANRDELIQKVQSDVTSLHVEGLKILKSLPDFSPLGAYEGAAGSSGKL